MSERETFYDDEIAPALLALAKRCEERGLSFLAVVEWEPGETARTVTLAKGSGLGMRLTEVAAQAQNNVDALMLAIMRHARTAGHSSVVLSQLGIPETGSVRD